MSFAGQLLVGVAEYLDAQGVGVWRPTGAYQPAEKAIVVRTLPQAPDVVVSLDTYSVSDDVVLTDSVMGLNILTRGDRDPRTVEDLDDVLFDVLHAAKNLRLNGIAVTQITRQSSAPTGADGNGRFQSSNNFYLDVHRPSRHRNDDY